MRRRGCRDHGPGASDAFNLPHRRCRGFHPQCDCWGVEKLKICSPCRPKGCAMTHRLNWTVRLTLAAAALTRLAPSIAANPGAEAADSTNEVVVTGTRVADRTRLDTVSPVDVLTNQALTSHATTELGQALANIVPSLDFPRPSITDGTDHVRPAALRGLSPDETLVLVNSKRRHASALVNVNGSVGRGSAAVDLDAIPLAAIKSIEV